MIKTTIAYSVSLVTTFKYSSLDFSFSFNFCMKKGKKEEK